MNESTHDSAFKEAVADRYLVDGLIGRGGMGSVWLARDRRVGRAVAIKCFTTAAAGADADHFLREVERTAGLQHPNVLPVLDAGIAGGVPYYVMPHIGGGSLRDRLEAAGALPVAEALRIVRDVGAALTAAHARGIVHCDVKPENILLAGDNAYLADFGIARRPREDAARWFATVDVRAYSPAYVSPEQVTGDAPVDGRADLYGLACVLYEMLTGQAPFEAPTAQAAVTRRFTEPAPDPRARAAHVPAAVAQAIQRAFAVLPDGRFPSVAAFLDALTSPAAGRSRWRERAGLFAVRAARALHRLEGPMFTGFWQDLRYAVRSLRRRPAVTAVIVGSLALAVGVNGAIFSVVNAVLLRPLPYPEPNALVAVFEADAVRPQMALAQPNYDDLHARARELSAVASYRGGQGQIAGGEAPLVADQYLVGADFFRVFGVDPALGRLFDREETLPGGPKVAIMGHRLWQSAFGSDRGVVGRTIVADGLPLTVVGVMPEGFEFPKGAQLWIPDAVQPFTGSSRSSHNLQAVGRIRPGGSLTATRTELATIGASLVPLAPEEFRPNFRFEAVSLRESLSAGSEATLWLLQAVVSVVLLIACANLGFILLAQATGRTREMAVRRAIGGGSGRLTRQLLTESTLLGVLGAGAGLLLTGWSLSFLNALLPAGVVHSGGVGLDWRVVGYALGLGVSAGLVFGLAPVWRSARAPLAESLRSESAGLSLTGGRRPMGAGLLAAQYALSFTALVIAAVTVKSLVTLTRVPAGFETTGRLATQLLLPIDAGTRYPDAAAAFRFLDRVKADLAGLPGVSDVSFDRTPPLGGQSFNQKILPVDAPDLGDYWPDHRFVGTDYFTTMGVPLVRGRQLERGDSIGAPLVAVINQTLANKLWGERDAVGRTIRRSGTEEPVQIVGVVADVKTRLDRETRGAMYSSMYQDRFRVCCMTVVMTVRGEPAGYARLLRDVVRRHDPDLALQEIRTFDEIRSESIRLPRFRTQLLFGLGLLAALLALLGVYGVMSYAVTLRRREMAVRSALGAPRGALTGLVLKQAVAVAVLGQILGVGLSLVLVRFVRGLLFGVSPTDPAAWIAAGGVLAAALLLAALIPARRAAAADPMLAIRGDTTR